MLTDLKNALNATGLPFAHFAWSKGSKVLSQDHGVWAEDSENSLWADNRHAERALQGTVDWYTRKDDGVAAALIEAALDAAGAAWYLNAILYEEDTGFLHYEWVFEAI